MESDCHLLTIYLRGKIDRQHVEKNNEIKLEKFLAIILISILQFRFLTVRGANKYFLDRTFPCIRIQWWDLHYCVHYKASDNRPKGVPSRPKEQKVLRLRSLIKEARPKASRNPYKSTRQYFTVFTKHRN